MEESNANIKNKKGKKKILIVIISIVLICLIVLFTLYKLSVFDDLIDDNNSEKFSLYPTENEISNAESLTYSPIRITCGNDETATPGFGYSIYEGENVYCTFSIMTYAKGTIDEIWFDYEYNEKFKYLNSRLINGKTQWDIDYSIKSDEVKISKNDKKINLIFNNDFSKNLYNFYVVEFKSYNVDSTGYYEPIKLSNIIVKTKDNKYYKYVDETTANGSITIIADANTTYSYKKIDDVIDFYKGKEKINSYKCTGDSSSCFVGAYMGAEYIDLDIGRALITDIKYDSNYNVVSKKYLLFDFNNGILNQLDDLDGTLTKNDSSDYKVYYILGKINNEQVIIDLDGNIIKSLDKYQFTTMKGKLLISDVYSISNNLIVLTKENKKGISRITEDKIIVDFKYDDIKLFNDKYFKAKINNLWYIYNLSNGLPLIELGYKELFILNNDLMLVQEDKYLYIKDLDGNNIIEDKIEVLYDYQEFAYEGESYGYRVYADSQDGNIINISLTDKPSSDGIFSTYSYKCNISEKKLTKTSN